MHLLIEHSNVIYKLANIGNWYKVVFKMTKNHAIGMIDIYVIVLVLE